MDFRIVPTKPDQFTPETDTPQWRHGDLYQHPVLVYPWQIDCIYRFMYAICQIAVAADCCNKHGEREDTQLFAETLRIVGDSFCEFVTELEKQQVKVEEVPESSVVREMPQVRVSTTFADERGED